MVAAVRAEESDEAALEAGPVIAGVDDEPVRVVRAPPAPVVVLPLTLAVEEPVMLT